MCEMATMLFSLFVFFILPAAASDIEGFSKNCKIPNLHEGSKLQSQCYDDCSACCGIYNTEIDLNNCIGNDNGDLLTSMGGYMTDCNDCYLENDYILTCTCMDEHQSPRHPTLDIRTVLVNTCGRLACMSHVSPQGSPIDIPDPDMRDILKRHLHNATADSLKRHLYNATADIQKRDFHNATPNFQKRDLHARMLAQEDTTSFTTTTIPPSTTFMFTSTRTFTAGQGPPSEITTPPGISISTSSRTVIFPNGTTTVKVPMIVWPSTLVTFTSGSRAHDVVRRDPQPAVVKRAPVTSQPSFQWKNNNSESITEMPKREHSTSTSISWPEITLPTETISIETSTYPGGTTYITHWNYTIPHEHHSSHHHGSGHSHQETPRAITTHLSFGYPHHNHTSKIPRALTTHITLPTTWSQIWPVTESTETSTTVTDVSSDSTSCSTSASESVTEAPTIESVSTSTAETTSSCTDTTRD